MADLDAVAKDFTKYYYSTFDNSVHRGDLSRLYVRRNWLLISADLASIWADSPSNPARQLDAHL